MQRACVQDDLAGGPETEPEIDPATTTDAGRDVTRLPTRRTVEPATGSGAKVNGARQPGEGGSLRLPRAL